MNTGFEFLFAVLANLIIELPLLFLISKFILKWGYETDHVIFSGTIATLMSSAYIWFVLPLFITNDIPYYIYVLQGIGILIEALVLYNSLRINFNKAFVISIVINIASFFASQKILLFISTGKF